MGQKHKSKRDARGAAETSRAAARPQKPSSPVIPPRLAAALPLGLAILAAIIVHYQALGTWFAQDDVSFIARARGISPTPWSMARPLSEALTWRTLVALFGLNPLPYHLFNFGLHLANVALVFAIGVRLIGNRSAAGVAAALFGISSIAFTPLNWISCLVELMVTTCSLAAFLLFLKSREAADAGRRAAPLSVACAVLVFAALVSKENAILLPLAFVVAHWRLGSPPSGAGEVPRARGLSPLLAPIAAAAIYAIAFIATLKTVHYVGSDAYAMSFEPRRLLANFVTYLRWLVTPHVPVRDSFAAADMRALWVGGTVAIAAAALLWRQRRAARHPEEVGAVWFLVLLAPVVPLAHHTYLYYLYLPLPGVCWMVAAAGQRLLEAAPLRRSKLARVAALALVVALVSVEFGSVRVRRTMLWGVLPLDKTIRESLLLKNAVADLRAYGIAPGDSIALVNPAPVRRVRVGGDDPNAEPIHSYFPLEGAMRGGETIRVFFPGSGYLGLARNLPPEWERGSVFLFRDSGNLLALGSGAQSLTALGRFVLETKDWAKAESLYTRAIAYGDTMPDAAIGLVATDYFLGRPERSRQRAQAFIRRWPDDPRSAQLAEQLRSDSLMVPQ